MFHYFSIHHQQKHNTHERNKECKMATGLHFIGQYLNRLLNFANVPGDQLNKWQPYPVHDSHRELGLSHKFSLFIAFKFLSLLMSLSIKKTENLRLQATCIHSAGLPP